MNTMEHITTTMMHEGQSAVAPRVVAKRRAVLRRAASALLLCSGAAVLFVGNEGSITSSPSPSRLLAAVRSAASTTRRSLKIEKIVPGRKLHSNFLISHLRYNPNPTTSGRQCETHYNPSADAWIEPDEPQPVPAGSKFERNNNFKSVVDYNGLNILVVGDSVGENQALFLENAMAEGIQEMVSGNGKAKSTRRHFSTQTNLEGRTQDRIWVNEVPAERGGGYVAFGRVLRMWHGDEIGEDDFLKWDPHMFEDFVNEYGTVDVLVYRTPWPWMMNTGKLGALSSDDYYRVLEVARRMVNPRTVIFATTAVNNNSLKRDGFQGLRRDNLALRNFVNNYKIPYYADEGVQNVMLMDWEKLTDSLVVANAETMGISADSAFKHTLNCEGLSKKHAFTGTRYCPHLTAMACAGTAEPDHPETIQTCMEDKRGRISPDGMHWCDATTGPRTAGGILCLTKCAIAADEGFDEDEDKLERSRYLKECQDRCNALWMNLDSHFVGDGNGDGVGHLELAASP